MTVAKGGQSLPCKELKEDKMRLLHASWACSVCDVQRSQSDSILPSDSMPTRGLDRWGWFGLTCVFRDWHAFMKVVWAELEYPTEIWRPALSIFAL